MSQDAWSYYINLSEVELAELLNDREAHEAALEAEEEEEYRQTECNCSDPDCPCSGSKVYSRRYLGIR